MKKVWASIVDDRNKNIKIQKERIRKWHNAREVRQPAILTLPKI